MTSTPSTRTQLTSQDKGKILAYMETLNAAQIARKMGRDPTTIRRFIAKYKETGKIETYHDRDDLLSSIIMRRMRL